MQPEIVQATPELIGAYYGKKPPHSLRGYVALLDGRPVGVAGIYYEDNRPVAFSDMLPELRAYRRVLVRGVRLVEQMMDRTALPVSAVINEGEPTAPDLLKRLGFVPAGEIPAGKLMVRSHA